MDAARMGLAACVPLAVVLVVYALARRSARRRVTRGRVSHPTALAVTTGWIWVSRRGPNGRPRVRQARATLVLLPDRVVAEPTRGGTVDIPLSSVHSAAWARTSRGRRTVAVLQLGCEIGTASSTPIFVDNMLGADTAEFATAVTDLLSRWLPPDRGPGQPPRLLVRTRRQRIIWTTTTIGLATLPVPAVVGLTALFGTTAGAAATDAAIPGAPGYYTVHGPHGMPLAVGAPWGTPCSPTVVVAPSTVPDSLYRVIAHVVRDARADGVNIVINHRDGSVPLTDLYPVPGSPWARNVYVVPGSSPSDAGSAHSDVGWNAALTADGQHENLTYLQDIFYLDTLEHAPPVTVRKVTRYLIGFSQGIGSSTQPGSAFHSHLADAADRFSRSDVRAMMVMSGCTPYAPQH